MEIARGRAGVDPGIQIESARGTLSNTIAWKQNNAEDLKAGNAEG